MIALIILWQLVLELVELEPALVDSAGYSSSSLSDVRLLLLVGFQVGQRQHLVNPASSRF